MIALNTPHRYRKCYLLSSWPNWWTKVCIRFQFSHLSGWTIGWCSLQQCGRQCSIITVSCLEVHYSFILPNNERKKGIIIIISVARSGTPLNQKGQLVTRSSSRIDNHIVYRLNKIKRLTSIDRTSVFPNTVRNPKINMKIYDDSRCWNKKQRM